MSDFKVSVTGSIGEGQYTFHGDTVAEVVQATADLAASMSEILDNLAVVKQAVLAKEVFTVKKFAKDAAATKPAAGGSAGGEFKDSAKATPGGGFTCDHGAMKRLDYEKKDGSGRVQGYYCQAPRGTKQCAKKPLEG